MNTKNTFKLVVAAALAFGGILVAGCNGAEEETPGPAPDPNRTVGTPPTGAEMGTANPAKAPTGPDGGPP